MKASTAQPYPWTPGTAEWIEGNRAYLSVVFSWDLAAAYARAAWHRSLGRQVFAGGPAVKLQPQALADVAQVNGIPIDALPHHNAHATFTTRGCIRRCAFCAVPRIEGEFRELPVWRRNPVVCDNNLLASSRTHFDRVIDSLKGLKGVDFNQGLDARLLTKHHATRIAELDLHKVRLAWDHVRDETNVHDAIWTLRRAGITKKQIRVYVLFGFDDTPEDALYRCHKLKSEWGIDPNPMRFQPLDALEKNKYVAPGWSDTQLRNMSRYWYRTRWLGAIPFEEYKRAPAQKPWLRRD